MGKFVKGEVVVVPFPFSDLSTSKRRPALVITQLWGDDVILCQITSNKKKDKYAIALGNHDFSSGSLYKPSNIRPNRIFTADSNIVSYSTGKLTNQKTTEVINEVIKIIKS